MTEQVKSENSAESIAIPSWFKIVAIIAFVWNLLGVLAFVGQMFMTPAMLAELPVAEQELYANTPMWATAAFAVAVFAGALGSLLLLMKKGLAIPVLTFSFVGVLVQMFHSFVMSKSFEVYGPGAAVMPMMVIIIAIYLVWLANKAQKNGWFN